VRLGIDLYYLISSYLEVPSYEIIKNGEMFLENQLGLESESEVNLEKGKEEVIEKGSGEDDDPPAPPSPPSLPVKEAGGSSPFPEIKIMCKKKK